MPDDNSYKLAPQHEADAKRQSQVDGSDHFNQQIDSSELRSVDASHTNFGNATSTNNHFNSDIREKRVRKTITKKQLEYYLSKAVDISDLQDICVPAPILGHSTYYGLDVYPTEWFVPDINGHIQASIDIRSGAAFARYKDMLRLIAKVKPKFISNASFVWIGSGNDWALKQCFNRVKCIVKDIKAIDPDIVVQAAITETMNDGMWLSATDYQPDCPNNNIPDWVWTAFNITPPPPNQGRKFSMELMRYDDAKLAYSPFNFRHIWGDNISHINEIVPDISKPETQMWFYYMGVRYIDAGCESLNFCQVTLMNEAHLQNSDDFDKPAGIPITHNPFYWNIVFKKLREYADKNSNIRFLLITGDTGGMKDENGNLAFDFHGKCLRPCEYPENNVWVNPANLPVLPPNGGLCTLKKGACIGKNTEEPWGTSLGGITPSGWYCIEAPLLTSFDNDKNEGLPDQWGKIHNPSNCCNFPFHWDELTWFMLQDQETRNRWQKYAYYQAQCIDRNVFFALLVRRGKYYANNYAPFIFAPVPLKSSNWSWYAPNNLLEYPDRHLLDTGVYAYAFQQEDAIAEIFSTLLNAPYDWVHHNFTDEEVYNYIIPQIAQYNPPNAHSDLVFVGDDKIYYISTDLRIHGYVKDPARPGVWMTVSPTWACNAQLPVLLQPQARNSLVANPNGDVLLYIGVDGKIHGFSINDIYSYTYFTIPIPQPQNVPVQALRDLIFASNDRIYYIGLETSGAQRIHGYIRQNNSWLSVSPPYACQTSVAYQVQASGSLTYHNNRLYYVGTNNFLYYFDIVNDWLYHYYYCNGNTILLNNNLKIISKLAIAGNKIFYVAMQDNQYRRVFCLIDNGNNNWGSQSPTWAAAPLASQVQPNLSGMITVDGNGDTIAYVGSDNKIYYYHDYFNGQYSYNSVHPPALSPTGSFKFYGEKLFYITTDGKLNNYSYEHDLCASPYISEVFEYYRNHVVRYP